jgi:hypothetical protein
MSIAVAYSTPVAGQTAAGLIQINQSREHFRTKVFGWQGLEAITADI